MRRLLIRYEVLFLALAACLIAVAGCAAPKEAGPTAAATSPSILESGGIATLPPAPRVSLADAKAAYDAKSAVFVDVRPKASYDQGHIAGAVSLPLAEMDTGYTRLDPSRWIITYCT